DGGQDFIVGVVRRELHRELETGGVEKPQQRLETRLALVPLVCRDHGRRNRCTLSQLTLAYPGLQARKLQKRRGWGGINIRLCHNTIVSLHRPQRATQRMARRVLSSTLTWSRIWSPTRQICP